VRVAVFGKEESQGRREIASGFIRYLPIRKKRSRLVFFFKLVW
jgi:hypothetical protein